MEAIEKLAALACPSWSRCPCAGTRWIRPVVVDVITNPRITLFLAAARQLAMQIFEQRTGVTPEEAVVQRAVAAALGE